MESGFNSKRLFVQLFVLLGIAALWLAAAWAVAALFAAEVFTGKGTYVFWVCFYLMSSTWLLVAMRFNDVFSEPG